MTVIKDHLVTLFSPFALNVVGHFSFIFSFHYKIHVIWITALFLRTESQHL